MGSASRGEKESEQELFGQRYLAPAYWEIASLEDVASILDSYREPINNKEREERIAGKPDTELYPYYGATGQVGYIDDYKMDGKYVLLGEDGAPFLETDKSKAYIVNGKIWVNNHAHILAPRIDTDYFCFYLNSVDYAPVVTGTTRLKLNQSAMRKIAIAVPPLNEQRRIVAKIEELFSELDKGVESLETARAQLKTYRQSLLQSAMKGPSASDTKEVPLGDLIGRISQGWSPKCELNRHPLPEEWAVIKTTAVQPMSYLGEEAKPLPSDQEPRPSIEVEVGDMLMTRKGPRVRTGVSCLVRSTRGKSMLCDTVYRFRCDEEKVDPGYLEIALNAPGTLDFIDGQKSGISDSGISLNQKKVKAIPIPLAGGLKSQRLIVEMVQEQLSKSRHLERELDSALARIETLRQSILKRAFEGKLVPQDPDDEPASALLERIRQEQADAPKPKRRKRKARASA